MLIKTLWSPRLHLYPWLGLVAAFDEHTLQAARTDVPRPANEEETFYLLSGELDFLHGNETFIAGPGDLVFVPRRIRHRFKNIGLPGYTSPRCSSCTPVVDVHIRHNAAIPSVAPVQSVHHLVTAPPALGGTLQRL